MSWISYPSGFFKKIVWTCILENHLLCNRHEKTCKPSLRTFIYKNFDIFGQIHATIVVDLWKSLYEQILFGKACILWTSRHSVLKSTLCGQIKILMTGPFFWTIPNSLNRSTSSWHVHIVCSKWLFSTHYYVDIFLL